MDCGAVVIESGDGSGNTSAPPDDPGFGNVGQLGSSSAVYVGNQWVLSAAHVGYGSEAIFGGESYGFQAGSATRLSNPPESELSGEVDLRMIRLDRDPGLPSLAIGSGAPSSGDEVVMIGRGFDRLVSSYHWDVDETTDPDTWSLVDPPPPAERSGFRRSASAQSVRWGTNHIDLEAVVVSIGYGDTLTFSTKFDAGGSAHEAQGVARDSGGGVFKFNTASSIWELSGTMVAISTFDGQPSDAVVFGTSTYAADLSFYRDEIESLVATPEPGATCLLLSGAGVLVLRRRRAGC